MKCIICAQPLTRRSYYQWEINDKRSISYECTSPDCAMKAGSIARCVVQITEPDNVITYYLFKYAFNGKMYRIRSYNEGTPVTMLQLIKSGQMDEDIIKIPRYMNLAISDDFSEKIKEFHKKLHDLLVFT